MNTAPFAVISTPRLPDLHLIVAPEGQAAAIAQALEQLKDQQPLLAWRLAAQTVRLLPESQLDDTLRETLKAGHAVTVWHGRQAWNPSDVRMRLTPAAERHADRVRWARIEAPPGEPSASAWVALAEQLSQPDDADLRLWLGSDGAQWPRWQFPDDQNEALNQQGLAALAPWVWKHLVPTLAEWSTTTKDAPLIDAAADPAADRAADEALKHFELQWPWQDDPVWEGEWLPAAENSQQGRSSAPANDRFAVLSAKGLNVTFVPSAPETRTALLTLASGSPQGAAADPVRVVIARPAADPEAPYEVQVTLPAALPPSQSGHRWCLWLHPSGRLPLALPFDGSEPAARLTLPWPDTRNGHPRYRPGTPLWEAIGKGSICLELV